MGALLCKGWKEPENCCPGLKCKRKALLSHRRSNWRGIMNPHPVTPLLLLFLMKTCVIVIHSFFFFSHLLGSFLKIYFWLEDNCSKILLTLAIQQHESATRMHMTLSSWTPFHPPTPSQPSRLSQGTALSSLCYSALPLSYHICQAKLSLQISSPYRYKFIFHPCYKSTLGMYISAHLSQSEVQELWGHIIRCFHITL